MHSRIFQVSEKPVEDYIDEDRYFDNFVGELADYVSKIPFKSKDYYNDLDWIIEATKGIEVDKKKGTIKIVDKKEYFEKKHEDFLTILEELKDVPLEDFINNRHFRWKVDDLESTFEDKHSFYIDDNDEYGGLMPLDTWVREAEEGKEYFIGSILDYHF